MVSIVSGNGLGFSNSSLATLGQRTAQGNAAQGRGNEQVFVNVATGNLVISDTDDRLVAHGGGYEAVRTYNSQGLLNDDNGDNWGTGFYRRQLVLSGQAKQPGSTITLTGRDGSTSLFTWDSGSSRYVSTDGAQAYDRIESTSSGFIWTGGQSQRREYYGASTGRLDKTVDASGNTTTYSYDADGNIAKVTDASGESVQYDYAGGLLMRVRVVDSQGKAVTRTSYAYDALKRLSAVTVDLTPADGSTTDGKLYRTSYTYDGDSRRVASIRQSDGTQLSIEYVQSGADYKVSVLRDALGQTYRFSYDTSARTTQVTDPAGQVSAYAYDAKGQLLSIASPGPGGARLLQRFEYNGNGDLVRTTDADGRSVFMAYDARGNQVLQRDAAGNTVTRTFNAQNQLLTETVYTQPDPDGDGSGQPSGALTSRYVYDDASGIQLRFMISAEGRVTEYRRNTYGEAVAVLQHHAAAYPVSSLARDAVPTESTVSSWASKQNLQQVRRTDYAFDYRGQMQTATSYASTDTSGNGVSAGSSVVRYVYDPAGRLLQSIDGKGATTAYAYDGLGRLISTTDGLGQLATTVYDDEGARIVNQAANGLRETRLYDRAGRLVSSQRSDAASADLGTSSFIYDAMGRLRSSQDANGSRSWVLYDEAGRKSAEVGESGALREYVYNGSGQVTRIIAYATPVDLRLLTTSAGSPAAVSVAALRPAGAPSDRSDWTIYDAAGRVWKTVGADGSVTENFYDGLSRLIATRQYAKTIATAALGDTPSASAASPSADASADRVTRHFYDADGLRTGTLDAEGYLVLNAYDAAGRLASTTRFARLTDASKRATGSLQDLKPATNSQDIVERRLYDEKHQLVGQIDGAGYLTALEYDANGNLAKQTRYATALKASVLSAVTSASSVSQIRPATSAQDQVRLYDYDALGRLAVETDYQGTRTEHAYDAAGNRIRSTVAAGTDQARTRLARYDSQGRLVAELSAEGARQLAAAQTPAQIEAVWSSYAKTHAYDLAGRRSATVDANGLRTLFFYNTSGQLTHTVNALGEVSETRYDALGQTVAQIRYGTRINPGELIGSQAGGLVNNKLLALLQAAANPALDQVTRTAYGAVGTVVGTTDAAGFVKNYVYNAFREEIQRTEATGIGATSTASLTRYDRRGLVVGQTRDSAGLAAVSSYKYDAFGNQISATDALGHTRTRTFDKLGREVTSTDAVWATLTTKYDAFNRVVSQLNAEGNTTTYAYDAKNRTVTISTDEGLLVKQTYNRHGDMVEVSDAREDVTRYTYDADGRQTGSSQSVWHFDSNITETVTTGKSYDRAGRLVETTDANGTRTTIAYDAANRVLTRTVDAGGLSLATQYAYDPLGRQISITQPGGTVTALRYDAKGQLVEQVVDPAGLALSTRYAYDAQGHTLEVIRPEGTRTRYTYDGAGRRISEQVDPDGLNLKRTYTYDLLDNLTSSVDANGNTSYYLYDDENRQTLAIDGSGSVKQTSYDALGRISKLVEYRNLFTDTALLQRYVAGGAVFGPSTWESQVREGLVPAGTDRIEYRSYDANNHLQSVVNGLGEVTTFLRDNNGRVMERRSFANRIAVGGADGWTPGTFPTPVPDDARDVRTRMAYDPLGRLIVKVDGTGAATKFRYDGAGNIVEQVRYAKRIDITVPWYDESFVFQLADQEGAAANVVEKSTYDAAQRLIWKSDGTGAVTGLRYDADGNVVKTVRFATALAAGRAPQDVVPAGGDLATDYVYDAAGRQIYAVGPDGAVVGSIYDRNGNLRQRTSYAGAITPPVAGLGPVFSPAIANHDRGSISRLLRSQGGDRTTTWAYDASNRQVLQVDALGAVTQTTYGANTVSTKAYANAIGVASWQAADFTPARVLGTVQGSGQDRVTVQTLDGAGRVVRTVDAAGYVVGREYDGTGQLQHVVEYALQAGTPSAQDRHTRYTYDGAGRLVGKTDALGGQQYHTYDALGNRIAFTNEVGAAWTYAYDLAGRLIREVSPPVADGPSGIVTLTGYDLFGNLVSRTEAAGRPEQAITRYEYDAAGRQTAVQTPLTRTTGRYDTTGRLTQTTDANGVMTVLAYDAAGRVLTRTVDPSGLNLQTRYTYDALGNQLSVTDAQGVVTQFGYDARGQLIRQAVDPTGLNLVTTFAYDSAGQQVSVTDPNGTVTRYEYDNMGRRVLEVVDPSTATHAGLNLAKRYTYDALGHVTSATDAQGHTTRYAYDAQGRQRFVLDAAGNLAGTAYDAAGRVVRQTRYAVVVQAPDGLPLNATEDQINGLKRPDAARDQTEHRIYDADNRVTATVNGAGDVVRFAYDGAGRVIQRTAYAQRISMTNWVVGTEPQPGASSANSPDMVTRTVYDAAGRVRYSIDGTGAVVSQRYDGNGNVTQRIRYAKRLDIASQPLTANTDEAELTRRVETERLYDAQRDEQTRMRYDAAGRVTLSADGTGGVSQYLYDKAGRMLQSTRYATPIGDIGTGDGPITVPQTSLSDAFVRKVYDAAGRLTKEVDASGAVSTYDYDAAGRLVRETRLAVPADAYRNVQAGAMLLAEPTPVASSGDRITRHFLDRAGREVLTIDAEGGATERFYDGAGQLLRVREGATQLTAAQVIQLESRRAQAGELSRSFIAQQAPWSGNDRITQNYYDAAGRLAFTRDALGHLQGYTYDGVGRLASRTVYMGEQSRDFWAEEGITGFTKTTGGEGLKPLYRLGGPNGVEDHLYTTSDEERAQLIANGWKDQGNVGYVRSQPASGAAPLYRLRPPGASTSHYYTASEELRASARDVLGWIEEGVIGYIDVAPAKDNAALYQLYANGTNRHFHGLSRSEVDYALMPNPGFTAGVDRRESMAYDAAGNLIATTDAANQTESTAYDGTGRKTSFTNKAQSTWTYAYNAAGQLVQETSPQVLLADLPSWRLAGEMTQAMASVVTRMEYDAMGHLTARTEAAGRSEQRTTRYEYDALGRQVKTIFPLVSVYQDEGANLLANGRIGSGSRSEQTVETSSETRYDTLGRAVAGRAAGGTAWSYKAYDRAGRLAWDVDALGYVTGYTRNAFGETERLVRYAQNITPRSDGVLMREDEVRGAITARASSADRDILTGYDRLGRVKEVQEPYVFFWDSAAAEQGAGRKTTRNTYDALGNLTSVHTNTGSIRWTGRFYAYDQLGRRTSAIDEMAYLSTDAYDAAGNVVRHVEYAERNAALGTLPNTGKGDRVTDTAYDVLGRKTSETRRGVGYTNVNAGAADVGGVLTGTAGDLATSYAYDALGNLLRTTNALGATTYQFYDALGRVRAIVTPTVNLGVANGQGKAPVNPLTEFRRDAHGNAVSTVQYAGGAAVSGDQASYTANAAPEGSANRTSYTRFDTQGHTLEAIDAGGNSHYYAYDAQGRLAKEWQNVSYLNDAGAWQVHSLWRAYRYDALGRQTNTYTPLQDSPDPSALRLGNTELQYNAFGEVTRKRVLWPDGSGLLGAMAADGSRLQGDEVYDYDNAGRLWRSNAGDGVMKIWAYDLQGRQTVQLVGAGRFKLDNYADIQQALVVQAGASGEFQRTDMQYDLLGRLTKTISPERTSEKAMGITTRQNLVYGVITSTETKNANTDTDTISINGQNQVDLVWRSLQDLGSGDMRITLNYVNAGNERVSRSTVVGSEEAINGYSFRWKTPAPTANQNPAVGVQSILTVKVEKLDIFGKWATIYDVDTSKSEPAQLNWTETTSPGLIWNEPGTGRKPIYRVYNRYSDTHLFSTSTATRDFLMNERTGWLDEGVVGYIAEQPAPGLTALYRLEKLGTDTSIYTTSDSQRNSLMGSGWQDRGIDGYVGVAGSTAAPAGMTKLYALQHHRQSLVDTEWRDGLYTTSQSERRALMQGLSPSSDGGEAQSGEGGSKAVFGGSAPANGNGAGSTGSNIGRLTTLYGAITSQSIEVSYPQDLVTQLRMEVRTYGVKGYEWQEVDISGAQRSFGAGHRIDVEKVCIIDPEGNFPLYGGSYEYRLRNVKNVGINTEVIREIGFGSFTIYDQYLRDEALAPPLEGVALGKAAIDGLVQDVLQWPQPGPDESVTFSWRTQGGDTWTGVRSPGAGIFGDGDGRSTGFGAGMQGIALDLGIGRFEFAVVVKDSYGKVLRSATSLLNLSEKQAPQAYVIAPDFRVREDVYNEGIAGYVWTNPGPGLKPLYRYYFPYQGNDHHITTADPSVIADLDGKIAKDAAFGSAVAIIKEGILGYVRSEPSEDSERLYQYIYGGDTVFRLTTDADRVGGYTVLDHDPRNDDGFAWNPKRWYQNAYQDDGYISRVPLEGTQPLYAIYDGNSVGTRTNGDFLTTTSASEVASLLGKDVVATKRDFTAGGLWTGTAVIDGERHRVLQWDKPMGRARVTVTSSPPLPGGTPPLFWHGDGHAEFDNVFFGTPQGFVLDRLDPETTYHIQVQVEHDGVFWGRPAIGRLDIEITMPRDWPPYLWFSKEQTTGQLRAFNAEQTAVSNRPTTGRDYDRWGNVISIDETQGLGKGTLVRTATMRYDANNQVIAQSRLHEDGSFVQSWATTQVYYDAVGRQVGVRDALGHLNAQVRDLAGNVVQERRADGGRMDYGYNAFGDKTSSAELMDAGRTVVTNYTYDQLSRLTQTSLSKAISRYWVSGSMNGEVARNLYDPTDHKGNGVAGLTKSDQTVLETVEYDEAGRKRRVTNGNDETTRYRYDRMGNVVLSGQEAVKGAGGAAAPLAYAMRYRYDALGRKIGQTDATGMTQAWSYDFSGRMVGRTDSQSNGGAPADFNFRYNFAGQLVHEDNTRVEPGVGGAAATAKKKNIDYRYDGAGQLIEIRDNYLGQTTRYEYDLAGNRVAEKMSQKTLLASGLLDDVVYQDNHLVYDAQHRLRAVFDGRSDVRITYDLAGNRKEVTTHVINAIRTNDETTGQQVRSADHTGTTTFEYDAMNRQTRSVETSVVEGARWVLDLRDGATPVVETTNTTHRYLYDLAGNRIQDEMVTNGQMKTYSYVYDDLHRIDSYTGASAADMMDGILYDGAGRQVAARTLVGETGGSYEYRYSQYDAMGKLQDVHTVLRSAKPSDNQKVAQTTNVAYHDAGGVTGLGYDAAGNLKGVRQETDGQATTTTYQYTYLNGSWQQSAALTRRGGDVVGTITQRDANGFVVGIRQPKATGSAAQAPDGSLAAALTNQATQATSNDARYDRTFVNDANGTAVFVSQGGFNAQGEVNSSIANPASGYQGGVTGSSLTPGHVQRQLVANGEVLARYGDAPTQEENTPQTNNPAYVDTADFRLQAAQIRPRHKSLDPVAYTVVGGETLKDIARNVLGDASLWWRIAEANSLAVSGDGALTAGQTLTVPKLSLNANSVDTFQPYDPSQAMGSMDPVLPVPGNGGNCGVVGQIISIVVSVVVSMFAGPVIGNLAGQMMGNLVGAQDGISWKSLALSAVSQGVASGLDGASVFSGSDWMSTALRMGATNLITQGIGVATGLQDRFDWRGVAASAAGGAAGAATGSDLQGVSWFDGLGQVGAALAKGTLSGMAAGLAAAVARGGRVSIQQVAVDAFGNALANSLAGVSSSGSYRGQGTASSPYVDPNTGVHIVFGRPFEPNFPQMGQFVGAFGEGSTPSVDRSNDVLLAAGAGYSGDIGLSDRDRNIARMLNMANESEGMGGAAPRRVAPSGLVDMAPTKANAIRFGLIGPDGQTEGGWSSSVTQSNPVGVPLPPIENAYKPIEGFFQGRYSMAVQGLQDPNASFVDMAYYTLAGAAAWPLAALETPITSLYNSGNNASLAAQYWAKGELSTDPYDANIARLSAVIYTTDAANGLLGAAAMVPSAVKLAVPLRTSEEMAVAQFPGAAAMNERIWSQRQVISGHGGLPENETFVVPRGTSITFYAEPGAAISNSLGNEIEKSSVSSSFYRRTYGPGDVAPNPNLGPIANDWVSSQPVGTIIRVENPTPLSEILGPNMGAVNWAACLSNPNLPGSKYIFTNIGKVPVK